MRWITHKVIPQIRMTRSYSPVPSVPTTYKEAVAALLASLEEQERLEIEKLQKDSKIVEQIMLFKAKAYELSLRKA
ncbi:MAG: hypothetical protein LBU32_02565 [Clostridiales bacterium]|jgi:prophage antirepressor-like protein|nr:hypothetical protein [Clostridiales bacterium]